MTTADPELSHAAARRLALLARCAELFGTGLELERTVTALAEIFVPAFADYIAVDLVEPDGGFRRVLIHDSSRGTPADWAPVGEIVRYPRGHPSRMAVEQGAAVVLDGIDDAQLTEMAPTALSRETVLRLGLRSLMAVPLILGETVLGVVGLGSRQPGAFGAEDRALAAEVGHRAASAVEAARMYAAERAAHQAAEAQRVAAEAAVGRLAVLHEITSGLAQAQTTSEVAEVVMSRAATVLGADSASLMHVSRDGGSLEIIASLGLRPELRSRFASFPVDAQLPASEVFRTGEAQWWPDMHDRDRRYPALAGIPVGAGSVAMVPLEIRGARLGVMALGWNGPREVNEQDRRLILAIASQCAQALDRAALLESERAAFAAAQDQRDRLSLLAEVGRTLSSSLNYMENLERVVRLVVPRLADLCWVNLVDDDGLRAGPFAHADAEAEAAMRRLVELEGGYTKSTTLREVALTGEPRYLPDLPEGYVEAGDRSAEALDLLRTIGTRSVAVVPLQVAGKLIGTMTLANAGSGRRVSLDDLELLAQMGRRVATAIDHARQFEQRAEVALTLQQSLLPREALDPEGLQIAQRYVPGTVGTEVGGDWYDVINLSSGRTALVIGDVMGRGIRAAAIMGQVRAAVRAYAAMELPPEEVLAGLDRVVRGFDEVQIVTAIYAVFDPGDATLIVANAGHPPPLRVHPGGAAERVVLPVGAPLGVGGPPYLSTRLELEPGDRLLLYTDGLVEDRTRDIDVGIDELCAALRESEPTAAALCEAALHIGGVGEDFGDDVAVLAVVVQPPASGAQWGQRGIEDSPQDVLLARRWAVDSLADLGLAELNDSVALVVSELVTNAMRYGSAPRLLRLRRHPRGALVEVEDSDRSLPRLRQAGLDDEGGRGLLLVEGVADDWGVRPTSTGKVVWVEVGSA